MKILGLKVENLRNVAVVDVKLDGKNWIEITGANGSGKTTLLDAIFTAILGTKHLGRGYPSWRVVKDGTDKARITATIGDRERKIEVRRSITVQDKEGAKSTGGTLAFTDTAGERLGQEFLDGLLSEFTVDPLAFARRSAKEQATIVRQLAGIDDTGYDAKLKTLTEVRRDHGVEVKRLTVQTATEPPEVDAINIDDVIAEKQQALDENTARHTRNNGRRAIEAAASEIEERINDEVERLAELQRDLKAAEATKETLINELSANGKDREASGETEEELPVAQFDQTIAAAATTNEQHRQHEEWAALCKDLATVTGQHEKADAGIKALSDERAKQLQDSNLPFKNLAFDDEVGLLIDGIPFAQKSSAEQLRISTRIGMEMKPDLRVISIKQGAMLDAESYGVLKALSEKYDYQVLVETVGEKTGENQIVLRAGKLVSAFETEPAPKTADEL